MRLAISTRSGWEFCAVICEKMRAEPTGLTIEKRLENAKMKLWSAASGAMRLNMETAAFGLEPWSDA